MLEKKSNRSEIGKKNKRVNKGKHELIFVAGATGKSGRGNFHDLAIILLLNSMG